MILVGISVTGKILLRVNKALDVLLFLENNMTSVKKEDDS